jgi:hypothetical protein
VKYKAPVADSQSIIACSFADSLFGFVSSQSGIYKTTDAGITWRLVFSDASSIMNAVSIGRSRYHAYACGISTLPGPLIVFTSDGGENWHGKTYSVSNLPYNIYSWDGYHATVVGKTGSVFHITDNTATWSQQSTPTSSNLFGISFGTIKAGYACGYRGTILRIDTDEEADVRNPTAGTLDALRIVHIFPNPAVQRLRLTFTSDQSGSAYAEVFDLRGVTVAAFDLGYLGEGDHTTELNLPELASGAYIVALRCGMTATTATLTIER